MTVTKAWGFLHKTSESNFAARANAIHLKSSGARTGAIGEGDGAWEECDEESDIVYRLLVI